MSTDFNVLIKLLFDDKLITLLIGLLTLIVAIYIPRKIMVDQSFIALVEQYRSPEMGFAIMSIFRFYKIDCNNNPDVINQKYKDRYETEIEDKLKKGEINPAHTLHFQRRLVAYFYWDLAKLYFESWFPPLKKRQLLQMVTGVERTLMSLVLQMGPAASTCAYIVENVLDPLDDEVPMNQCVKRLYDKTEDWL